MRWLLIVLTAAALLLGLAAIGPAVFWRLVVIAVHWVLPTPLVAAAVFGRGDVRAFSIGALIPWVSLWIGRTPLAYAGNGTKIFSLMFVIAMSSVCGIIALSTRRWLARRGWAGAD